MSSIHIFCHPNELRQWIVDLCKAKDLGVILDRGGDWLDVIEADELRIPESIYQFYLFPKCGPVPTMLSMNDIRQRDWGWVMVRPGGLKKHQGKTVLLLAEIHGEKCQLETGDPDKWVKWLKKKIKPEIFRGVKWKGNESGQGAIYNDIWYSKEAIKLFESGVGWKQFQDAESEFEPVRPSGDV
jgi:hypothetical protein